MKTLEYLENDIQTGFVLFGLAAIVFPETVLASIWSFSEKWIKVLKWGISIIGLGVMGVGLYLLLNTPNKYQIDSAIVMCIVLILFAVMKFHLKLK